MCVVFSSTLQSAALLLANVIFKTRIEKKSLVSWRCHLVDKQVCSKASMLRRADAAQTPFPLGSKHMLVGFSVQLDLPVDDLLPSTANQSS